MKKLLLFINLLFLNNLIIFAQDTIVFGTQSNISNIGKQVYLFEDKEGKLSFEDIQKPEFQNKFKKSEQEIPNFNTTRSTIWVKLNVHNQTDERIYLEVAQALAWYINFYKPDATGKLVLTTQTGMMRPFKNREVDNNFFLFELPTNCEAQTYYFSIKSDFPLNIPLSLAKKTPLMVKSIFYHWFFGAFSGLVLIMFFYNLFVAYSIRNKLYVYYCLYLLNTLFIVNYASCNFGYQLNPISYYPQYLMFFVGLNVSSITVFILSLLDSSRKSSLYYVLMGMNIVNWIFVIINLFTGRYILIFDIVQGISLLFVIYILVYSIRLYLNGNQNARFVVFGFSFYLVAVIIYVLQNFGLIATNFFTNNAIVFGSSIEILLFSLALAEKINAMRREKELAQSEVLQKTKENEKILKEQNQILEIGIQEATEELQSMNEELNSTVEELSLTLETLEEQNNSIMQNINYACRIQEAFLPKEDTIRHFIQNFFILFKPRDVVSGDFYFVEEVAGKVVVGAIDCTGHGVSGAFMTMLGNDILHNLIDNQAITSPDLLLNELHKGVRQALKQAETENRDGMDVALLMIDHENKKVEYAGAKNPLIYIQNNELHLIKADKTPIGGEQYEQERIFTRHIIDISLPTTFYLFSDGYQDQFGGEQNKKFGIVRMKELFLQMQTTPLPAQKQCLDETFERWRTQAGEEQIDDVLIMGIQL